MNAAPWKRTAFALALAGSASVASSLGLGDISVSSGLNQRLTAVIPLTDIDVESLDSLQVGIAGNEAFSRMGLERADYLSTLRFAVKQDGGKPRVVVTSSALAKEPVLTLLVQARSQGAQVLREYTILLDPPDEVLAQPAPAPVKPAPTLTLPLRVDTVKEVPAALVAERAAPLPAPTAAPPINTKPTAQRVATEAPVRNAVNGSYGPVKRGETLWRVAVNTRYDGVGYVQMMLAIVEANRDLIADGRTLPTGAMLRIPSAQKALEVSKGAAQKRLDRYWAARSSSADAAPDDVNETPAVAVAAVAAAPKAPATPLVASPSATAAATPAAPVPTTAPAAPVFPAAAHQLKLGTAAPGAAPSDLNEPLPVEAKPLPVTPEPGAVPAPAPKPAVAVTPVPAPDVPRQEAPADDSGWASILFPLLGATGAGLLSVLWLKRRKPKAAPLPERYPEHQAKKVPAAVPPAPAPVAAPVAAPVIATTALGATALGSAAAALSNVAADDDLDFMLDDVDVVPAAAPPPAPVAAPVAAPEPKAERPPLEFPGFSNAAVSEPKLASTLTADDVDRLLGGMDMDFGHPDAPIIADDLSETSAPTITPIAMNSKELTLPGVVPDGDVDFAVTMVVGAPPESPLAMTMTTKLDMARAYVEMGDGDTARKMLGDVSTLGDNQERSEAEALLKRIQG